MPQYFSPVANDQIFDANGDPLVGGQIETYIAQSSTPAATYTDNTGVTPQSNPIILNSLGWPTLGAIWLTGGNSYKFIIKNAAGSTLRTIDNIVGIGDTSISQSEWVESGFVPTYISGTSFSVPGDQTAILQIGRRLRTTNTSGLVYSTISNSVFAAGITTVTLTNDSTTLDAGLSLIAYALLAADPLSVPDLPGSKITGLITDSGLTMPTDGVLGRVSPSTGEIEVLSRAQQAVLATSKIQPVTATVNGTGGAPANGMLITLNPTTLDFRSTTLGSGAVNTRSVPAAITLTISSGSTLGTTNAVLSRLAVLAIDNAGTVELAVSNLSGAVNLNETGLISTTAEGGAGAADSATVVYSATARTNVPYRIVGFIESTQATAGTWATAPSLIVCGVDLLAKWLAGYGQTWQLVTRTAGVTYDNLTGRNITLVKNINAAAAASCSASIAFNGGSAISFLSASAGTGPSGCAGSIVIPAGASYVLAEVNVTATNNYELR